MTLIATITALTAAPIAGRVAMRAVRLADDRAALRLMGAWA